jgi:hypothetical protein
MKYIYFVIIFLILFSSCTNSDTEQKNRDIIQLKKSLDSLKTLNSTFDKTLDSLKAYIIDKESNINIIKQQLDSLQKNIKETEGK